MSETGITGLLRRVLGTRADEFEPRAMDSGYSDDAEVFEVRHESGRVVLAGTNPIAQASALRAYLRERCATQVSTDVAFPTLPARLPVGDPIRRAAAFPYRYHYNVVTFAYTTVWWDWSRWERELDRLAMHGVNRPLIMTGHEAVTQRVFADLGRQLGRPELSAAELRAFPGGPAYLPFWHLGCLTGWDGPLPQRWIDRHAELAARILDRARELGMRPVLPGFAGHVPAALGAQASVYPVHWAGFTTYALDPRDPLFADLGARFIRAQRELFGGTDHLYAADPFIEMTPRAQTAADVAAVSEAIFSGMRAADAHAVWVLQSWPFTYHEEYWTADRVRAFLGAVPDDRMLILDLWSEHRPIMERRATSEERVRSPDGTNVMERRATSEERVRSPDGTKVMRSLDTGKQWVWCMLHNFGGRPGMYGKLGTVASAPASSAASGVGATMEDFGNDPVCYELLADVVWCGRVELEEWLDGWVVARYGPVDEQTLADLRRAWRSLRSVAYESDAPGPPGAVLLRRPTVDGDLVPAPWLASEAPRWTSVPAALWSVWELSAEALHRGSLAHGPLGRDLTDVAYLVLTTLGNLDQAAAARAFLAGDEPGFTAAAQRFLTSIDDLEQLLATRPEYLLGRWLTSARQWGETEAERAAYEADARRLITVWGRPDGELVDYARRGWSGLVGRFYLHRWRQWVDELATSLSAGAPLSVPHFNARIQSFELAWVEGTDPYPTEPAGSTAQVAAELYERWR